MDFPTAVRKAFPKKNDDALRQRILTLALDGGEIHAAGQEFALTFSQRMNLGLLIVWLRKVRGQEE